ncbi:MAG TPA: PEP-CTERM sorting domain-containing protein [Planctomycetota bacterium]|nr:PEP-CTERM sorting domain-containing protein [Planctomycetota bacterium]HRR79368.1 PEP-CTERM sorting domain-containing protein [Planctomycetota bacterium]HRT93733.1 PEP-CTERM sorting domain-containing protein [Planctomycetota bacterium]
MSKRAVQRLCLLALAALASAHSASALVLYSDDFSGASPALLNGTVPDVSFTGQPWTAGSLWFADGSKTSNGSNHAWLPFIPYPGNRYTLSLDVNPNIGATTDWFALGFSASNVVNNAFHDGANQAVAWMLNRDQDSSTSAFQTFLGPSTANGASHDPNPDIVGWLNMKVILDTQGGAWTAEWFVNNVSIRGPVAFGANPTITYVGFGSYNNTQGFVDNFLLTADFPHVLPPPLRRHYTMDDNAASPTVTDSANALHAAYVGANTDARHAPGRIGAGALTLNGTSDYILIDNGVDINFGSGAYRGLTMAGWVRTTDLNGMLLSFRTQGGSGNPLVELGVWNGRPFGQIRDDAGQGLQTIQNAGPLVNDNAWHHLAVRRRDDGFLELYADGLLVAVSGGACTGAITTSVFRAVGAELRWVADNANSADQRFLAGLADDLGIWNAALSPQHIALIHALGYFNGTDLASPDIPALLDAYNVQGLVALANSQLWGYATGLTGPTGTVAGAILTGNATVVLNGAAGTGLAFLGTVPEPATLALLALGGLGLLRRRRRPAV